MIDKHLEGKEWLAAGQYTLAGRLRINQEHTSCMTRPSVKHEVGIVTGLTTTVAPQILPISRGYSVQHTQVWAMLIGCMRGVHAQLAVITKPHAIAGVNLDEFPNVKAWVDRIYARPAVQRGLNVPEENKIAKAMKVQQAVLSYGRAR